jgi:WD40 repeat protein
MAWARPRDGSEVVQCNNVCIREETARKKRERLRVGHLVTMSPCGQLCAVNDDANLSNVNVWNIGGGVEGTHALAGELKTCPDHVVTAVEWSHAEKGRWICTVSDRGKMVRLWDWHGRTQVEGGSVAALNPSIVLGYDDLHKGWNRTTSYPLVVRWSPERNVVALALEPCIVLFDLTLQVGQKLKTGIGHPISCMTWTRDGHGVIYADHSGQVCMVDVLSGRETMLSISDKDGLWTANDFFRNLGVSSDGKHVIGICNQSYTTPKVLPEFQAVRYVKDGKFVEVMERTSPTHIMRVLVMKWRISDDNTVTAGEIAVWKLDKSWSMLCLPVGNACLVGGSGKCIVGACGFPDPPPRMYPEIPMRERAICMSCDQKGTRLAIVEGDGTCLSPSRFQSVPSELRIFDVRTLIERQDEPPPFGHDTPTCGVQ